MDTVNIHEAKTHFSKLVARAEQGESVLIAKAGRPVARIVPVGSDAAPRRLPRLGFLQGLGQVPGDIKKPFEKEINAMFHGAE